MKKGKIKLDNKSIYLVNKLCYDLVNDLYYEIPIIIEVNNDRLIFGDYYYDKRSKSIELFDFDDYYVLGKDCKKIIKANRKWNHMSGLRGIYNNNIIFDSELVLKD